MLFRSVFNSPLNSLHTFTGAPLTNPGTTVPFHVASLKPGTNDVVIIKNMLQGANANGEPVFFGTSVQGLVNVGASTTFSGGTNAFGGRIQAVLYGDNFSSATGNENFAQTSDEDWTFTEILTPNNEGVGAHSNLLSFNVVDGPFSGMIDNVSVKALNVPLNVKFQGSHLIYEHEYQCTVDEHEFNDTLNISARKIKSNQSEDLANFATGSLFRPYVTTIGLYNEDNELLVVGKLGQPIRTSDETDTTFIVRWDT